GVRAVAEAHGPALRIARSRVDGDRNLEVLRPVAPDVHVHGTEVIAAAQRELQVDEALGVERLAALDVVEAADEGRVEDRLLYAHVAEVVARPAVEDQPDVGFAPFRVHADFALRVAGIEESG